MLSMLRMAQKESPNQNAVLQVVRHASLTSVTPEIGGVLLDERRGKYWLLRPSFHQVMLKIGRNHKRKSFGDIAKSMYPNLTSDQIQHILDSLWGTGCLAHSPRIYSSVPRIVIAEYVVCNVYYRVMLRLFGWRIIWRIRRTQSSPPDIPESSAFEHTFLDGELVTAAAVLACCVPFVSAKCITQSLAMRRMMERRGHRCNLMIGTREFPFDAHMWVDVDGHMLNPSFGSGQFSEFTAPR